MKPLRSFGITRGVALALGGVLGAAMLSSSSAEGPATPAAQAADVRAVAALPPPEPGDFRADLRVDALAKIAKLGSAVGLGPGKFKTVIKSGKEDPDRPNVYPLIGELTMPPSPGYFVVFRFMPVTNATSLVQLGDATGTADLTDLEKVHTVVRIKFNLVISDVRQNGVPVDVGSNCRTATPIDLTLDGHINLTAPVVPPTGPYPPEKRAGTVKSSFAIPAFTGCGVTENLSPLITGLVSGPNNDLITYLGKLCFANCKD